MSRYRDDRDDYYGGRRYADDERRGRDYAGDRDGRDYRDRDYFRNDYETGAVGRRGEARDYERAGRGDERPPAYGYRGRGEREDREGHGDRPPRDEGRDYFAPRAYGRGRTSRSHLRCRDIMTRDVTVATRDATLEEVARMMRDEDTGVIPVVEREGDAPSRAGAAATGPNVEKGAATPGANAGGEGAGARRSGAAASGNGRLVGLITDRDIVVRALAEGRDARATRAEEIMTAEVHAAHPNDRVIDAIRKMGDKQVRRIPIVDREGTLRGIISMADVALETNDDRELAEALEEISSGHSFWNRIFG
jgi:CBS domain-containing protein